MITLHLNEGKGVICRCPAGDLIIVFYDARIYDYSRALNCSSKLCLFWDNGPQV